MERLFAIDDRGEEHEPIRGNPRTADLHILNDLTRIFTRGREMAVVETKCRSVFTPISEFMGGANDTLPR